MLDRLKELLKSDTSLTSNKGGEESLHDLELATAVLLLQMAGADDDYAPEEVRTIKNTIQGQFGLDKDQSQALLEEADALRSAKKIDDFVSDLNENYNDRQRQLIFALVWKVVVADAVIQKYEQKFAAELRLRLDLSRDQADEAKRMVHSNKI